MSASNIKYFVQIFFETPELSARLTVVYLVGPPFFVPDDQVHGLFGQYHFQF